MSPVRISPSKILLFTPTQIFVCAVIVARASLVVSRAQTPAGRTEEIFTMILENRFLTRIFKRARIIPEATCMHFGCGGG